MLLQPILDEDKPTRRALEADQHTLLHEALAAHVRMSQKIHTQEANRDFGAAACSLF